jgi:putative tryptophan/tyrosine transport system substrate-binding protein
VIRTNCRLASLVALLLLAAPLAAEAQQAGKVHQIGVVWGTFPDRSQELFAPLRDRLRELGYVEGQNIFFQQRWAEGRPERIPDIMASLVRLNVDVIVVPINPIIGVAKRATTTIPILMLYAVDPVGAGFVASLAKPGGNVTGLTMGQEPATFAKNLQLLKEASPHVTTVVLLSNPDSPNFKPYLSAIEKVARPLGIKLQHRPLRAIGEIDITLSAVGVDNRTALLVFPDAATYAGRDQIVQWTLKNRVPATASFHEFAQSGGLMAYGTHLPDLSRRGADYIDKLLKGAKPADLPVEIPTTFRLTINLKTARGLGLSIPPSLLVQADQVID